MNIAQSVGAKPYTKAVVLLAQHVVGVYVVNIQWL